MKRLIIITVTFVTLGFVIMMVGFVYDVMYAGIPYPDPTPELAAEYERAKTVSETLFVIGALVASLGSLSAIWAAYRMIRQLMIQQS